MRRILILVCLAVLVSTVALPGAGHAQPGAAIHDQKCEGGEAGGFPCKNVDLMSYLPPPDIGGGRIADVWGWADPDTGKEYALLGSTTGLKFVDVTDPSQSKYLGQVVVKAEPVLIWMELEVYKDHVFIICDLSPCGLQIFDLTRLRGVDVEQPWTPDRIFPIPFAHSIDLNPDTGFLYVNGMGTDPASAQIILDVNDPKQPVPVGTTHDDGYSHDSLCRNYYGPDKDYKGSEICFNFNEDTITIYDMTDKMSPVRLSRVTYDEAAYVHSGTLTKDHKYLVSTDEGDETGVDPGTLFVWDISDLEEPVLVGPHRLNSPAIDHNLFTLGKHIFHANYTEGLRVYTYKKIAQAKLKEVAYFDIVPMSDAADFDGAWAVYPFLPSGNVLVGGMGQGLAVVHPTL
ncbi:MAG TPA: choice-of-anchor B family protein [Actinomycetota bacterium]|nr:choice-of-anchor B family protein [Actinomycetota bacterium]